MRDDAKKNLKRVEEELLAEVSLEEEFGDWIKEEEDWLEDARELLTDNASRSRRAFDFDAEEEDDSTVYAPSKKQAKTKAQKKVKAKKAKVRKEKGVGGLVFLALLELVGIAAVLVWWVLWLL